MVIVKIMGGLGNQMFQYAAARRLALANNAELKLDIRSYHKNSLRQFQLDQFNIQASIATEAELARFERYQSKTFSAKARNFLQKLLPPDRRVFMKEKNLNFDATVRQLSGNVYLWGYWQSERYFKDIEDIIRSELMLKQTPDNAYQKWLTLIKKSVAATAIHVRRTDYLSDKLSRIYAICQPEFYAAAAHRLTSLIKKESIFFVFSDDINWAKNNLKLNGKTNFVSQNGLSDGEELILMSECRHNITANSSFSWWGAWLNKNPEKIIIAPRERLKDKNKNSKDIYPPSWITI